MKEQLYNLLKKKNSININDNDKQNINFFKNLTSLSKKESVLL